MRLHHTSNMMWLHLNERETDHKYNYTKRNHTLNQKRNRFVKKKKNCNLKISSLASRISSLCASTAGERSCVLCTSSSVERARTPPSVTTVTVNTGSEQPAGTLCRVWDDEGLPHTGLLPIVVPIITTAAATTPHRHYSGRHRYMLLVVGVFIFCPGEKFIQGVSVGRRRLRFDDDSTCRGNTTMACGLVRRTSVIHYECIQLGVVSV